MIRNETFQEGVCIEAEVIDLDAGTVTFEVDGKAVESRRLTDDEKARYAPTPPPAEDRIAALEAQNADLLAKLAAATTLAAVRKAATDVTATMLRER